MKQVNFQTLKNNYIKGLLETDAFIIKGIDEEPFTLRSGRKSYMFLDHSKLGRSPNAYRAFIDVINTLLMDIYGDHKITLCNVDSKISAQMVGSLAYIANYPQIIYKSRELVAVEKGTRSALTGNYDLTDQIAIIDDVATGGDGTAKGVGDMLQESFPHNTGIRIFVGFVREIQATTYPMHHVVTRTELIQLVWKGLTEKQQQAIDKETTNQ